MLHGCHFATSPDGKHRGIKEGVRMLTDNLILEKTGQRYRYSGSFTTELLTLPPEGFFDTLRYKAHTPKSTGIGVDILNQTGEPIFQEVKSGTSLHITQPVQLRFIFSTKDNFVAPVLDSYNLSFDWKSSGCSKRTDNLDD